MWKILLPDGQYLESVPALSFDLYNQVFKSGDTSALPGSFSFPFDLPLTRSNKVALNNPHLVNNSSKFTTIEGCTVYAYGIPLFIGRLTVTNANSTTAQVNIVINPLITLKEKNLNEIDLGGDRSLIPLDLDVYFATIAKNPEDYDYILFPVIRTDDDSIVVFSYTDPTHHHNYFDRAIQEFDTTNSYALTPFVKLKYLLQQMFEIEAGVQLDNVFQQDIELARLYVYNNIDMRNSVDGAAPNAPSSINLSRFVPEDKCNDYLKKIVATFCLGIFTNVFSNRVRIVPLNTVLQRDVKYNWTEYLIGEINIEESETAPGYYNYGDTETPPADWPDVNTVDFWKTTGEYLADTDPVAYLGSYFYIEETQRYSRYIKYIPVGNIRVYEAYLVNKPYTNAGTDTYSVLLQIATPYGVEYQITDSISRYEEVDDNGVLVYKFQEREYKNALLFYRGIQPILGGLGNDAYAANHVWKPGSDPATRVKITTDGADIKDAEYSLNWYGDYGLYNQFHKRWNEIITNGKIVSLTLELPVSVLVNFSFEDKVKIHSMDYFVTQLRLTKLSGKGRAIVEATLISII